MHKEVHFNIQNNILFTPLTLQWQVLTFKMYSLFKQRLPRISSDLKEQGMQIWTPDLAFVRQQPRRAGIILVEITISPTLRIRPASIRFAGFLIRLCLHHKVSCFNFNLTFYSLVRKRKIYIDTLGYLSIYVHMYLCFSPFLHTWTNIQHFIVIWK